MRRTWLSAAVILLLAGLGVGLVSPGSAATAPQSWGGRLSCTADASGYCTLAHPASVVPDAVTVSPETPAITSVDSLTATTFRVRFCRLVSAAGACTALTGTRAVYAHVDWSQPPASPPASPPVSASPSDSASPSPAASSTSPSSSPAPAGSWPGAANTGVPAGVTLHACASTITAPGNYDACQFAGGLDVRVAGVVVTRSEIDGQVSSPASGGANALVIGDSTISCGCPSVGVSDAPAAVQESNFTLLRVNLYGSAHGVAPADNVVIQDSWIHGLGGNTDAHKDAIYVGNGDGVVIRHNSIECNDGPKAGCTSAIGLLTDFGTITNYTIDDNLLNTNGAYCLYGSGGPSKAYVSSHLTITNNHFGRLDNANCGFYGPVTYVDMTQPGMVWSGNVWDDTGAPVAAAY